MKKAEIEKRQDKIAKWLLRHSALSAEWDAKAAEMRRLDALLYAIESRRRAKKYNGIDEYFINLNK